MSYVLMSPIQLIEYIPFYNPARVINGYSFCTLGPTSPIMVKYMLFKRIKTELDIYGRGTRLH